MPKIVLKVPRLQGKTDSYVRAIDTVPFPIDVTPEDTSFHLSYIQCSFLLLFGSIKNWNNYILSCPLIYFLLIAAKKFVEFFVIL